MSPGRLMQKTSVRLAACAVLALSLWLTISGPAGPGRTSAESAGPTAQLYIRAENWDRQLQPLNPSSLTPARNLRLLQLGSPGGYQPSTVLASSDGTTAAAVSVRPMATSAMAAKDITVRVIDARTGTLRSQFHPAVPLWIMGISGDGSEVFGWGTETNVTGKALWEVLSTKDGSVVPGAGGALSADGSCCGQPLYDAAARRLYVLTAPQVPRPEIGPPAAPPTPTLVAFDLATDREVGRLPLEGMSAGTTVSGFKSSTEPVSRMSTPGFALSPDRGQIAVLDGETGRLDLIDARRLTLQAAMRPSRPAGLLEKITSWLGLLPAPAFAKEWLGFELSMQYSGDGRYLYVTGRQGSLDIKGMWTVTGLGLRLIDLSSGQITADGMAQRWITRLVPSPDSGALYAVTQPPMGDGPVTLERLDPETLQVRSERAFYDPPELYMLSPQQPVSPSWSRGWPMMGHDPQRTNRSPVSGPAQPSLLFERKGLTAWLAGPDGTIYAISRKGLTALSSKGEQRWVVKECCGEGPPALAANGMILGTGFRNGPPATQSDTEAIGITSSGKVAWRIQPFGVLKGSIPLVSESNLLYLPIKGPEGVDAQGLNIMSTDGKLLHKLPPIDDLALGVDGTNFSTTQSALQAHGSDGSLLWTYPLQSAAPDRTGPLVGRDGTVYLGEGQHLDAFSPSGALLWRYTKTDGALTLAERADGVILVAGRRRLDAVSPDGMRLWQATISRSTAQYAPERPSLIVDGDGTAYVGSEDGLVRAISVDGAWQASFDAGGSHDHFTPGIILDADGRLIVSGTDGVMRVYEP